jgi:hypothetical protein
MYILEDWLASFTPTLFNKYGSFEPADLSLEDAILSGKKSLYKVAEFGEVM